MPGQGEIDISGLLPANLSKKNSSSDQITTTPEARKNSHLEESSSLETLSHDSFQSGEGGTSVFETSYHASENSNQGDSVDSSDADAAAIKRAADKAAED